MEIIQNAAEFDFFQPEMSVVGTFETCRPRRAMSEFEGKAETIARIEFFSV
jgi:hypothetical protein